MPPPKSTPRIILPIISNSPVLSQTSGMGKKDEYCVDYSEFLAQPIEFSLPNSDTASMVFLILCKEASLIALLKTIGHLKNINAKTILLYPPDFPRPFLTILRVEFGAERTFEWETGLKK